MGRPFALIVDRDPSVRELARDLLEEKHISLLSAGSGAEALEVLRNETITILMVDLSGPGVANVNLLDHAMKHTPAPLIIALTDQQPQPPADVQLDGGIAEVLQKPIDQQQLCQALARVICRMELQYEITGLREKLQRREGYSGIVGRSAAMDRLRRELERLGPLQVPVWIRGKAGSGKELAARNLHNACLPKGSPFAVLDGDNGSNSEMTPVEMSALVTQARGGTLYIEGITTLSQDLQERLAEIVRNEPDPRIVAASADTPEEACEQGHLIGSLADCFVQAKLYCPDLVDRREDIHILARHFVDRICEINHLHPIEFTPDAVLLLEGYAWPGQVQELRNAVEHAVIQAVNGLIHPSDLPLRVVEEGSLANAQDDSSYGGRSFRDAKRDIVDTFEQSYLSDLLERHSGNVTLASQQAGMLRSALQRLLRKHGLKSSEFREDDYEGAAQETSDTPVD
jgi:DNA-binding NtrC family response regulator